MSCDVPQKEFTDNGFILRQLQSSITVRRYQQKNCSGEPSSQPTTRDDVQCYFKKSKLCVKEQHLDTNKRMYPASVAFFHHNGVGTKGFCGLRTIQCKNDGCCQSNRSS